MTACQIEVSRINYSFRTYIFVLVFVVVFIINFDVTFSN